MRHEHGMADTSTYGNGNTRTHGALWMDWLGFAHTALRLALRSVALLFLDGRKEDVYRDGTARNV